MSCPNGLPGQPLFTQYFHHAGVSPVRAFLDFLAFEYNALSRAEAQEGR
jgi:hypothetical protein